MDKTQLKENIRKVETDLKELSLKQLDTLSKGMGDVLEKHINDLGYYPHLLGALGARGLGRHIVKLIMKLDSMLKDPPDFSDDFSEKKTDQEAFRKADKWMLGEFQHTAELVLKAAKILNKDLKK